MDHDLARVSTVTSFQMDSAIRVEQGYTFLQSILCKVALADPGRDVRGIPYQDLSDLFPAVIREAWSYELGVNLCSPLTLCLVVNGLPTFGGTLSDNHIIPFLHLHCNEIFNPFPFNKFYVHLSYDRSIVSQAKTDLNPMLMNWKAADIFGLYCWRCHDFQTKGVSTCCLLVQEFRGKLLPSHTTYLSVVYVNRPETARGTVNPLYAWSRTSMENQQYHEQFGLCCWSF
jgi:hypothetical protein